ncbi:MAG: thiolase family protein [Lysobacterales bacterium]
MTGKPARKGYEGVVIAAPITVPYERYSHQSAHWWAGRALAALSKESSLGPKDVDGFCVSSFSLAPDTAVGLTQHVGLSPRWLDHIPMGGASGVVALRRAARAVQCGDAEVVACVAADTNQVSSFKNMLTSFSRFSQDAAYPYGSGGPNANFALMTKAYMNTYGVRREDFGRLCVDQRSNALDIPFAMMKRPLTLEQYMGARSIADPLHLFDCVMPCAGAEGFLVMSEQSARDLDLPYVEILSTIERHNAFTEDPIQLRGGWVVDRDQLWAQAGITPDDIDLLQTYDDYPVICAMQIEDLGFCEKGAVSEFIASHTFTNDGSFPHNTSGGQLSTGQAGAAGGYIGLVDAVRQLIGRPIGKPVLNARTAAVSGFGMINFDRGVCTAAAILAAGGSGQTGERSSHGG